MTIILYTTRTPSPPTRAVEMVIRILELEVEYQEVDVTSSEHLEPWFLELNPAREPPVLDDNGYVLTDSHAIIAYLFTVYATEDVLEQYYPTDPKQRGIINSRWYFENGVLYARAKAILLPLIWWREKEVPLEKTRWLLEGVWFLEKLLEGKKWLAGERLTIADICTITTIDLIEVLVPLKYYKNVTAWAKRVRKTSPFYDEVGIEELRKFAVRFKENTNYDPEKHWREIQCTAED